MLAYLKAIAGAVIAGGTALAAALDDQAVSGVEWAGIAVAVAAGAVGVWAVPNVPPGTSSTTGGRRRAPARPARRGRAE